MCIFSNINSELIKSTALKVLVFQKSQWNKRNRDRDIVGGNIVRGADGVQSE